MSDLPKVPDFASVEEAVDFACKVGLIDPRRAEIMRRRDILLAQMMESRPYVVTYTVGLLIEDIRDLYFYRRGSPARAREMPRLPEIYETVGVYVARDGAGDVVYVGCALNLQERFHQHIRLIKGKSVYGEMVRANMPDSLRWAVDFYPTTDRKSGLELEKQMIRELQPLLNKTYTGRKRGR